MNKPSSIKLVVDVFAGADIQDVADELCALSEQVGILCEAKFNGVKLWAKPGDNAQVLAANYMIELRSTSAFKIAKGRP